MGEALAVKYRPRKFADVVEQTVVKSILTEQLEKKTFKNCLLFCGGAGTGKAQPLYSKVLTPNGFIEMGNVKEGTLVITGKGNVAEVSGIYPQGIKPIYEVTLTGGQKFKVSDEHLNVIYNLVDGEYIESIVDTKHLLKLKRSETYMRVTDIKGKGCAYYLISTIKKAGNEECQCIYVDAPEHTYITDGCVVTHNTTSARIFAKEINDFKGHTIEIDAASHNGVDDARRIIEDAKTQALDCDYKVFVIDECVPGDTEILTNNGWKRIDTITNHDSVAQYNDGKIEFISDYEYIDKYYEGDMYNVSFRNGKCSVLMSPHHVQPVKMVQSGKIVENYISDCKFNQRNEIIVSGSGTGVNTALTSLDRLFIACQADGYFNTEHKMWELHLTLPNKKNRAIELLDESKIPYKIYGNTDLTVKAPCSIRFYCNFPTNKKFKDYFDLNMGELRAKDFISEILLWDGSEKSGYPGYYSCVDKDNVDFVSVILAQCNCSATQKVIVSENANHQNIHSISWYYKNTRTSQAVSKEKISNWKGHIYCVKVPSHMILIRAQGFTVVTGNCHMISTAGWNALLKLVEEPPKKSVLVFCTTDPQKIPATILSRVQRFNFQKISLEGIIGRLKFIIESENKEVCENRGNDFVEGEDDLLITYEDSAIEYIAKQADGGMRDSITLLDKCISYNKNLTLENVLEALGSVDYNDMFNLTDAVNKMDGKTVIEIIENIHKTGLDLKQFIKTYSYFLLDLCKYELFGNFQFLQMPSIYDDKMKTYTPDDFAFIRQLFDVVLKLNKDIQWETVPKPMIESCLLLLCQEG